MDIERLGVKVHSNKPITRSAIISLNIALKAYLETYKIWRHRVSITDLGSKEVFNVQYEENFCHEDVYQEKYLQVIFHFHHFLELFLKDILREVQPILSMKLPTDDSSLILKILNGEPVEADTIEFMAAVNRIQKLPQGEREDIKFVVLKHKETIKKLNQLRNRAWHRGTFYLKYSDFDFFIANLVLPLIIDCLSIKEFQSLTNPLYIKPDIDVDPIKRIIGAASSKVKPNFVEMAFFKCIGLACYGIPPFRFVDDEGNRITSDNAKRAQFIVDEGDGDDLRLCFVCGSHSLVLYLEEEHDDGDLFWFLNNAKCEECGLFLDHELGNPKEYGINIPDLWGN